MNRYLLISAFLVAGAAVVPFEPGPAPVHGDQRDGNAARASSPSPSGTDSPIEIAAEMLRRQGWAAEASATVTTQSERYLRLLYEDDRSQFERTISLLGRLGPRKHVQDRLTTMPEIAGLLAGALELDAKGPEKVLSTIPVGPDRDLVLSLYVISAAPPDCLALAATLERDRDIILRLCRRGAMDAMLWFTSSPAHKEAAQQYRAWLRIALEAALNDPDEDALDRVQTFLAIHATSLRKKLDADASFRQRFLSDYWPEFDRILKQQDDDVGWGIYVSEPRVWDFLHEFGHRGLQLFKSHGPLAVDLLLSGNYQECREQILGALEAGDELTIQCLYDDQLRGQPLFVSLLRRNLPGGTLAKAFRILADCPTEAPKRLEEWGTFSDSVLMEHLGPPPEHMGTWLPGYNLYYLGRKLAQDRDITGMDVVFAGVDTVEVFFMAKGASKGLKVIQHGLRQGLAARSLREAGERLTTTTARQLFPWVLREGHRAARSLFKSIQKGAVVDVTDAVRFAFEKSGVGRETFKRFSRLEARVFMRADRRVAVDLTKLVGNDHIVGRTLRVTALNAGFDLGIRSDPGQTAARTAIGAGVVAVQGGQQQVQAWKEHLGVWWLATNDGSLERAETDSKQQKNVEAR